MASEPNVAVLDIAEVARPVRAIRLCGNAFGLLGADQTGSEFSNSRHNACRFLFGIQTWLSADSGSCWLIHTLLGTLLVAAGTGTLNQFLERSFDAQMRRTARRPLASGRLKASHVLWFGISLSLAGTVYLALAVNVLASLLAVITLLSYLFLYTPLKRKTPLCTLIGAFPGAVPPLIGWAAARGRLDPEAWVLYAMVFLWQFPHFMAIAWMYREDYARAGYLVLPLGELRDRFVIWQSLVLSLVLIPHQLDSDDHRRIRASSIPSEPFCLVRCFFTPAHALLFTGRMSRRDNCSPLRLFIFP